MKEVIFFVDNDFKVLLFDLSSAVVSSHNSRDAVYLAELLATSPCEILKVLVVLFHSKSVRSGGVEGFKYGRAWAFHF